MILFTVREMGRKMFRWSIAVLALLITASLALLQGELAQNLVYGDGEFVTVDDVSLFVVEYGEHTAPPVVFLHGTLLSSKLWLNTLTSVADAGYHVIAFDRPPFGLAERNIDLPVDTEFYLGLIDGLLDAYDLKSAHFVGHSEGGSLALLYALAYPERVRSLSVLAPSYGTFEVMETQSEVIAVENYPTLAPLYAAAKIADLEAPITPLLAQRLVTPEIIDQNSRTLFFDDTQLDDNIIADFYLTIQVDNWELPLVKYMKFGVIGQDASLGVLRGLDMPVWVVWGKDDPLVPLVVGEAIVQQLYYDAEFTIYPDTGHMIMLEVGKAFDEALVEFLNQQN